MRVDECIYKGKSILAKDPNRYINDSQMLRAERFYGEIAEALGDVKLEELKLERVKMDYPDPMEDLPLARSIDYGDYNERKRELLEKGRKWFQKRVKKWNSWRRIPELKFKECNVSFSDGKTYRFGRTEIRFSRPFFHGIEYARVGWVVSTVITYGGSKLIHTSDLEGPVIEDQADWIIKENPEILVLDGPSTYLIPYMLNMINLRRAVRNMCRIIEETENLKLVIYDHHLTRDRHFKDRVKEVYEKAVKEGKEVVTVAEYLGETPTVLRT